MLNDHGKLQDTASQTGGIGVLGDAQEGGERPPLAVDDGDPSMAADDVAAARRAVVPAAAAGSCHAHEYKRN